MERSHRGSIRGRVIGNFLIRGRAADTGPAAMGACGIPRTRVWRRAAVLTAALTAVSLAFPLTASNAQQRAPRPSFNELVAQARLLAHQIDQLSEQYDGLRVQLTEARAMASTAARTAARDAAALGKGQVKVGAIAVQSYESGGYDPTLTLVTTNDPQGFIDRASIMDHLQAENGAVVSSLQTAQAAASRAAATAQQQAKRVSTLAAQMAAKRNQIQSKINLIESAAYKQALAIANQTGHFPVTAPIGDSLGARALQAALTRQGAPYVWGAAGPWAFDCSGLVMWAFEQVGIQLPHYTGYQFNAGVHVSQSQLQAGDLVFFYPDIGHVGIYVGGGLMLDAPNFGETVHVEPVMWGNFVGAVRIGI